MIWNIIDGLPASDLGERAGELYTRLRTLPDQDLLAFHDGATSEYLKVFNGSTFEVYCAVFEGEANGGGFTDFCSNLILGGSSVFFNVVRELDWFATVHHPETFDQDHGVDVSQVARTLLCERYGEERCDQMIHLDESVFAGTWALIDEHGFEPDWELIKREFPRIYYRFGAGQ